MSEHASEVESGERFEFGKNWKKYSASIDENRIAIAEQSLKELLSQSSFDGLTILDIGSGSGLFSLGFRRMGATVTSFDFDPNSVLCTKSLKDHHFPNDPNWNVLEGSVLDQSFLKSLGKFDLVYSWGVLHHTGSMWEAIENALIPLNENGRLAVGLYRDLGIKSKVWHFVKKTYCSSLIGRWAVIGVFIPYYILRGFFEDVLRLKNPLQRYRERKKNRGMNRWHDWIDWIGGYPYEYTSLERLRQFVEPKGMRFVNTSNRSMVEAVFEKATH